MTDYDLIVKLVVVSIFLYFGYKAERAKSRSDWNETFYYLFYLGLSTFLVVCLKVIA